MRYSEYSILLNEFRDLRAEINNRKKDQGKTLASARKARNLYKHKLDEAIETGRFDESLLEIGLECVACEDAVEQFDRELEAMEARLVKLREQLDRPVHEGTTPSGPQVAVNADPA